MEQLVTPEVMTQLKTIGSTLLVIGAGNILKGMTAGRKSYLIKLGIDLLGVLSATANGTKEVLQKVQDR